MPLAPSRSALESTHIESTPTSATYHLDLAKYNLAGPRYLIYTPTASSSLGVTPKHTTPFSTLETMEVPTTPSYKLSSHPGDRSFKLESTSKDITLRIPTIIETSILLDILGNKENSKFDKSISDANTQELESIAHRWTTISHPLTHLNFLIWNGDTPIGITGMGWIGPCDNTQPDGPRAGAAGIVLQPFARGKGFAYEALKLVFEYGLCELGLAEIRIGSYSENMPMRMLMEKKFGLVAETSEGVVDEFGNDLMWVVKMENLGSF